MQHAWLGLHDRLEVTATAWYCGELLDRSLEERHAAEPLYLLLRRAYELLDAGMAPGRVARWFEMRLCDELGVRPEVDRCVECDRLLEAGDEVRWIPRLGGVLCGRHAGPSMATAGLSTDALKVLKAYQRMDVEALAGLRLPGAVEAEVERVLGEFVRHVMERDTRSRRFLEEVRAGYAAGGAADAAAARCQPAPPGPTEAPDDRSRRRRPARCAVERLERELILWLTTVTPAGQPQTSPVWFLWADGEILRLTAAPTRRGLANIRANPGCRRPSTATATAATSSPSRARPGSRASGRRWPTSRRPTSRSTRRSWRRYGWTMESMLVDYPVEIRIRPTRSAPGRPAAG